MMFAKKEVLEDIRKFAEDDMTPINTAMLACLMIINDHCALLPGGEETEDGDLTAEEIHAWVNGMENADGTRGPHWTMSETEAARAGYAPHCNALKFYAVMNMMYSDYCRALDQTGSATLELYALLSKAFLADPDAQPHKLARYIRHIARHEY